MKNAHMGLTYPHAGVMPMRPARAPHAAPTADGNPVPNLGPQNATSSRFHVSIAIAVAFC